MHFVVCELLRRETRNGLCLVREALSGRMFEVEPNHVTEITDVGMKLRNYNRILAVIRGSSRIPKRFFWARFAQAFTERPSGWSLNPSFSICWPDRSTARGRNLSYALLLSARSSLGHRSLVRLRESLRFLRKTGLANSPEFYFHRNELADALDGFRDLPASLVVLAEIFGGTDLQNLDQTAKFSTAWRLCAGFFYAWSEQPVYPYPKSRQALFSDALYVFLGQSLQTRFSSKSLEFITAFILPTSLTARQIGRMLSRDQRFTRTTAGYWKIRAGTQGSLEPETAPVQKHHPSESMVADGTGSASVSMDLVSDTAHGPGIP